MEQEQQTPLEPTDSTSPTSNEAGQEGQTNTEQQLRGEVEHSASKNIVIVVVVAIIIVVLALMYMWGARVQESMNTPIEELPTLPASDEQVENLKQVSTSDELEDIERDIDATELDNLDADLTELEAEIDAALVE